MRGGKESICPQKRSRPRASLSRFKLEPPRVQAPKREPPYERGRLARNRLRPVGGQTKLPGCKSRRSLRLWVGVCTALRVFPHIKGHKAHSRERSPTIPSDLLLALTVL